jgi:hypothetical protein
MEEEEEEEKSLSSVALAATTTQAHTAVNYYTIYYIGIVLLVGGDVARATVYNITRTTAGVYEEFLLGRRGEP